MRHITACSGCGKPLSVGGAKCLWCGQPKRLLSQRVVAVVRACLWFVAGLLVARRRPAKDPQDASSTATEFGR